MHVVLAMMVMVVTFFAIGMVMVTFVIVVVSPFHEQRFHACQFGNGDLFLRRNFTRGFLHERFHLWTNPDH